jgi:hypothetical protein
MQPDEKPERKRIKKEPKQKLKVKTELTPQIKSKVPIQQPTKKQSFSVVNTELKTKEDDIITTVIQEYDKTLTSVGVCMRTQGSIK